MVVVRNIRNAVLTNEVFIMIADILIMVSLVCMIALAIFIEKKLNK